jgi:hypothetical protein
LTNGDVYEGDFKNNKLDGEGDFNGFDGYKYSGTWVAN